MQNLIHYWGTSQTIALVLWLIFTYYIFYMKKWIDVVECLNSNLRCSFVERALAFLWLYEFEKKRKRPIEKIFLMGYPSYGLGTNRLILDTQQITANEWDTIAEYVKKGGIDIFSMTTMNNVKNNWRQQKLKDELRFWDIVYKDKMSNIYVLAMTNNGEVNDKDTHNIRYFYPRPVYSGGAYRVLFVSYLIMIAFSFASFYYAFKHFTFSFSF